MIVRLSTFSVLFEKHQRLQKILVGDLKRQLLRLKPMLLIQKGFNADPDPAFLVNADPDPGL